MPAWAPSGEVTCTRRTVNIVPTGKPEPPIPAKPDGEEEAAPEGLAVAAAEAEEAPPELLTVAEPPPALAPPELAPPELLPPEFPPPALSPEADWAGGAITAARKPKLAPTPLATEVAALLLPLVPLAPFPPVVATWGGEEGEGEEDGTNCSRKVRAAAPAEERAAADAACAPNSPAPNC